ncbi:MAG: hypothetical protein J0L82_12065 [Deltaproteobacteria bacterium]|jgi:hypothetical protein|nr:hypothetical protein [Deltaproteobacteria bacterium]
MKSNQTNQPHQRRRFGSFVMPLIAVSALFLGAGSIASAQEGKSGLMIEPSISYEVGYTSIGYPAPFSNSTGTASGLGLGARLGFHFQEAFFLGLDARYSFPQYTDSSVNYDSGASSVNWGPVIGMQMPNMGLRVWGALILGGDLDPAGSNFDVNFQSAKGYRVGAGFHVYSLSLNLEYQSLKYDQTKLEQLGPFNPGTTLNGVQLENKSWIASVSFPLEI